MFQIKSSIMNIKMLLTFPLTLAATCATAQTFHYPKAPQNNTIDTYFGTQIADPYRPLEDDNSIETQRWVTAENELTRHYLDRLPMRPKLLKRLKEVANYEKIGTPFKRNNTWYVYKNNGLQNQSVLYKMDKLGGTLYEVLDPNKLSTDGTVALKGISFSHNGR
ncbi:MAG: S9 family peptidase, partial [Prevotella salivae]|nr:S9 family peptidase [Segatella salivae]